MTLNNSFTSRLLVALALGAIIFFACSKKAKEKVVCAAFQAPSTAAPRRAAPARRTQGGGGTLHTISRSLVNPISLFSVVLLSHSVAYP